ncbi:TonB-dependent receptor [Niabella yanshanensis]|uniref:TonB-dependent receptor n=1 Tax=Niabella yanshanensis TaxID=577386 RepID=A0ABZ0W6L4_9BACT|nr:TonB-dependent receptor [Niabella yanshanensis]WQD38174.1 TonB-dependent receptor [Niabella yanshanensis]
MTKQTLLRVWAFLLLFNILVVPDLYAQQEITITGIVKDPLNAPMIGVSIENLRSKQAVISGENGVFSIQAAKSDSLIATFVGYKDYRWMFNDRIDIQIVMEATSNNMDGVVIVGFGQQKKISLVGAQSTVDMEDIKIPVANLSAALSGRIAGLIGVQRTGLPGSNGADLWIRGISTFGNNSSSPLVVVDGVIGRDINAFDPEDIASFSILKDASATAVYGIAGANGVILITTKKGRPTKPVLMFNYTQGFNSFTKLPELTDGITYMQLRNEAQIASGLLPEYSQAYIDSTIAGNQPYVFPNVDWMSTIFGKSSQNRRANFSARGGADNANYYVGLAYYEENSLLKLDELQSYNADARFRRINFTSNVNMNWTKSTKFELGIQGYVTNTNMPGTGPQDAFARVMQTNPVLYPVMYPGNLLPAVNQSTDAQPNPWGLITQRGYVNTASNQLYSNARITQDMGSIAKGLSATILYSFDVWNSHSISRTRDRSAYQIDRGNPYLPNGSLNLTLVQNGSDDLSYSRSNGANRRNYMEASVNYDRDIINDKNHITAMILYNQREDIGAFANDLTSSLPTRSRGLVGRATYAFDNRYFGEFNFGYNGSENFAPENRYGFFPSFGVGYVVSNEKFFEPFKEAITFLKLRYSNGVIGSGSGGRRFGFLTIVNGSASGFTFGNGNGNVSYGGTAISEYGSMVRWSEVHKQNFGVEIKTLNNKISLTADFFNDKRTGIFLQRSVLPDYIGINSNPYGNLGSMTNKGFDFTFETTPLTIGQTYWDFRANVTYNRDMIIENDQPRQPFPYMERRGFSSLSRYGYVALGLFESEEDIKNSPIQRTGAVRVGDIKYKDINGDGVVDANDVTRIGNGDVPNLIFGASFNVTWKQFYLGAFFQGTDGADRMLGGDGILPFNNSTGPERSNLFALAADRWSPENPNQNAFYPRLGYGNVVNQNNSVASTWWVKDMDFVRLKTIDLGYNFHKGFLSNLGLKNGRIYLQGVNIFYWSKFKLWDPELNTNNGASYPNIRTVSVGIQANF